jgi:hypothetical protein
MIDPQKVVAQENWQNIFPYKELFRGFCKFCDRPLGVEGVLGAFPRVLNDPGLRKWDHPDGGPEGPAFMKMGTTVYVVAIDMFSRYVDEIRFYRHIRL